jgi:hypothetical protein
VICTTFAIDSVGVARKSVTLDMEPLQIEPPIVSEQELPLAVDIATDRLSARAQPSVSVGRALLDTSLHRGSAITGSYMAYVAIAFG